MIIAYYDKFDNEVYREECTHDRELEIANAKSMARSHGLSFRVLGDADA